MNAMPSWINQSYLLSFKTHADTYGVDPKVLIALCHQESRGNPWATRYEPNSGKYVNSTYPLVAAKIMITGETERLAQMHSWGIAQVMGWVARGLGFQAHLTQLLDPDICISLQAELFSHMQKEWPNLNDAISAYNQGHPKKDENGVLLNQKNYVDPILATLKTITL